jgi:hypothetical protein
MHSSSHSRFDAQTVVRLATVNEQRRLEMQFSDAAGKNHVVSLPFPEAVQLGCFICEVSEQAPFVFGGAKGEKP